MARGQEKRCQPTASDDGSTAKTSGELPVAALAFFAAQCGGGRGPLPGAAKKGRDTLEEGETSPTHRSQAHARQQRRGCDACLELAAGCEAQCHGGVERFVLCDVRSIASDRTITCIINQETMRALPTLLVARLRPSHPLAEILKELTEAAMLAIDSAQTVSRLMSSGRSWPACALVAGLFEVHEPQRSLHRSDRLSSSFPRISGKNMHLREVKRFLIGSCGNHRRRNWQETALCR